MVNENLNVNDTMYSPDEIFNLKALNNAYNCYICETVENALFIKANGGEAIALGNVRNVNLLLDNLIDIKPKCIFYITLSGSEASEAAINLLTKGLRGLGIYYNIEANFEYFEAAPEEIKKAEHINEDYTEFFNEAHKNIDKTNYHRGLSEEILNRFNIGYVEEWRHPKAGKNAPATPRLIIPTSKYSYVARDTRTEIPEEQEQYKKMKTGKTEIFNINALKGDKACYIVEGEIDALSIIDAGGEAIGLGSTVMVNQLLEVLENTRPAKPLIISLDNDGAGAEAIKKLENGLKKLKFREDKDFYIFNAAGEYKDANEALQEDRACFTERVKYGEELELNRYRDKYTDKKTLKRFLEDIEQKKLAEHYPTGFKELDRQIDGGLYSGLYIIGAISSLGKTTFCLQMADNIAASGKDILIVSLEMGKEELIAKRLSRLTYIQTQESGRSVCLAKTTRGILSGEFTEDEKNIFNKCVDIYEATMQDHIYTLIGEGNIGTKEIRAAVEQHVRITGKAPVVFVDYLQMIAAPAGSKITDDKQKTDNAVLELKRISRDFNTPVVAISSFNRANYHTSADMEAFKESGGIEYSSDILIGLQYSGTGEKGFNMDNSRSSKERRIEAKILKNRNGATGAKVNFKYNTLFNYFYESKDDE